MEAIMKTGFRFLLLAILVILYSVLPTQAQDLGPGFTKIKDGIYVFAAAPENSTCSIIVTQEGVVMIDSCHNPPDSHKVLSAVKKITDKPIRFLINTETHNDHTTGHFVFSPPAVIINHEGATEGMKKAFDPKRIEKLAAASPEMAEAVKNYKLITPHIEYRNKMTLNMGDRTLELLYLKNVHSEADTAIWLPNERVLFAASAANVRRILNLRLHVTIPEILASYRLMKSLNPEVVVPGHGPVSTTKIFDEYEQFYTLLLQRVSDMAAQGKPLDQIKKELKMPEFAHWSGQDRLGVNIDVAYKSVKQN
jgi:cyclase